MEKWKEIPNYDGIYQASSHGNIRSLDRKTKQWNNGVLVETTYSGKVLKPRKNKAGYLYVNLYYNGSRKTFTVHKLVGHTFLDAPLNDRYNVINHLDGNKVNNRLKNLELTTAKGNIRHAIDNGLHTGLIEYNKTHQKRIAVISNNKVIETFENVKKCAEWVMIKQNLNGSIETVRRNISSGAIKGKVRYGYHYQYI